METAVRFALSNFTFNLLVLGLVCSAVSLVRQPRPWSNGQIVEALLSYFLLFSIGVSYVYNVSAAPIPPSTARLDRSRSR
jgi:hypothetical protein